jgi:acyl carrier protein
MYRTGDRVRRRPDRALDFLGRIDHQIKLRGHRIELGEIEARVLEQPGITAAAVIVHDVAGDPRLVAYIVRAPDAPAVDLIAALRRSLPEFMIPSHVVELAALPRSPAGKLDRRALPAPDARPRDRVPPRDDLERRLVALWQDVLAVADVGIHDSFFDLGGHSLSATRLASRIRDELAIELPLRVLFEATTVAALADAVRGGAFGAISHDAVDAMADLLDLLENPQ